MFRFCLVMCLVRGSVLIEEWLMKVSCIVGYMLEKYCLIDRLCVCIRIGYMMNSMSVRLMYIVLVN